MHLGAAGLALAIALVAAGEAPAPSEPTPPATTSTESTAAAPVPSPTTPAPEAVAPQPKTQVKVLPDSEKVEQTRTFIARMREILARVVKHLEEARDERDIIKLNCVNEKLTAIKGLLKISEQADVTLQECIARRDAEAAAHEFEKVSIALRKCEQLLGESEGCVGELAVYSGDTEVELLVEGVPENDPTMNTGAPAIVFRPPPASPFQ